jgi:exodeoxyribonuclease VII large subunit
MSRRSLFDGAGGFVPASPPRPGTSPDPASALTVSELLARIKAHVDPVFVNIWVEGEVCEFRGLWASGHAYFAIKDAASLIRAKMWRSSIAKLKFPIENGASVVVRGSIETFAKKGEISLTIDQIIPKGIGEAAAAFEALRKKLDGEGLFAPERKRAIPMLSSVLGLVTSREGAAIRDFLRHLRERTPARIVLAPTLVQGAAAPESIADAIEWLSEESAGLGIEAIAVVRGGGGMEDLAAFNSEVVARAIATCRVPVVTGIGHEIDTTIADLVADRRAKTPTDAANVLAPDREGLMQELAYLCHRAAESVDREIESLDAELDRLRRTAALAGPSQILQQYILQIGHLGAAMASCMRARLGEHEAFLAAARNRLSAHSPRMLVSDWQRTADRLGRRLTAAARTAWMKSDGSLRYEAARLEGRSPVAILARGYSIAQREGSATFVTNVSEISPGDVIKTRVAHGEFTSRVLEIRPDTQR